MNGLGDRVLVAALEGWSDAAEASTAALQALRDAGDYVEAFTVDPELYFDYQYTRPLTTFTAEGERVLTWPSATIWRPRESAEGPEVWLLTGMEPARLWQAFTAEIVDQALTHGITGFISLGSMMSDPPHSRPLPVHRTSDNADLRGMHGLERSQYEGPAGVLTVLQLAFEKAEIPSAGLWTTVPHYGGAHSPSPKATLALLDALDALVRLHFDREVLVGGAARWEAALDVAVAEDPDLAAYVSELERAKDEWDSPEASGEAIAREFERYLRRDGDGPQRP